MVVQKSSLSKRRKRNMGLFNKIHDFVGVNANKLSGSLRETSQKMKDTKDKLKNSEKCKKIRMKQVRLK